MKLAVAGATGVVGQHVVTAAHEAGHDVVSLSRSLGLDLTDRASLRGVLNGVTAVIDVSNPSKFSRRAAADFFTVVTNNLIAESTKASVEHFVSLSIVGIDRASAYGYYQAKLLQEAAVKASAVPSSIVRATQFHEFAGQILHRVRIGPFALVPHMQIQSVAARCVGELLVETATGAPLPTTLEVAGPDVGDVVDHARLMSQRRHGPRVIALPVIGKFAHLVNSGVLLPTIGARTVGPGFYTWLDTATLKQ